MKGSETIDTYTFGQGCEWIVLHSNSLKKSAQTEEYAIDKEIISYALDKNERTHMEYDWETDTFTLIYNVLNPDQAEYHYETVPMTFCQSLYDFRVLFPLFGRD